jgi:hypothetical protein
VGVRGVNLRLDVRAVVEENIEDEMALMLVRADARLV